VRTRKKLAIISNYITMQRCYTKDNLSFVHLCDDGAAHRKSE